MMKYFTHTNAGKLKLNFRTKMNLLTTGLIFFLLLLSTFLGNGVMILLIHHGFINALTQYSADIPCHGSE